MRERRRRGDDSIHSENTTTHRSHYPGRAWLIAIGACVLVIAVTAVVLYSMGRPLICTCGTVKLWHGEVMSSENSQHISDWYSISHVVHGFLLYFLFWLISLVLPPLRKVSVRLVLAVILESAWEVLENTEYIINRYREATISLDYVGDSVLNSTMDIVFMSIGFLIAARIPMLASASIVVALEVLMVVMIRDNLALNILMLIWPVEAIKTWQAG